MILPLFMMILAAFLQAPQEDPIEINNEAVRLMKEGNLDRAIRKLGTAHNLAPDSGVITKNLASALAQRGIEIGKKGNFLMAVEDLRTACKHAPKNVGYRYALASFLYRSGDLGRAEFTVEAALKLEDLDQYEADLMRLKGNILYLGDRLEEALDTFQRLVKSHPKDRDAARMLSKIERDAVILKEYRKDVTRNFKFLYGPGAGNMGADGPLIGMLEDERSRVCSDLNYYPRGRVTVIVYSPQDFKAVMETEGWVGGIFDRKIRIPLSDLHRNPALIRQIIRHEYTHVIVYELAPGCPAWINEGLATWQQYGPGAGAKNLETLSERGVAPVPFDQLPDSFIHIADPNLVRLYYIQSHAMIEYLVDHFGLGRIRRLLRDLNKEGDWKTAFRTAYAREFEHIERDWKEDYLDR